MLVLLISGSLRAGSTNTSLLRTARAVVPAGVGTRLYDGMAGLPHFNPDDDTEGAPPPAVAALRAEVAAADALLLCTPEYAGALPGAFKNLLEWLVGGPEIQGKPVAYVNVSGVAAPTGGADAHDSLRKVLRYLAADVVEPACVRLPMARSMVDAGGEVSDPAVRAGLRDAIDVLLEHARTPAAPGG